MFTNGLKKGFSTTSLSQKESTWSGNTNSSLLNKYFRAQQSVKKVILTDIWDMEQLITIDFLEKGAT